MNAKPKVLFTDLIPDEWIGTIQDKIEIILNNSGDRFQRIEEVEGIFSLLNVPIRADTLKNAKSLKVISNMAVGFDNIDVQWCTENRIPVGNTPDTVTDSTADAAFGLIIAASRNFNKASADARSGKWKGWSLTNWLGMELSEKTLGILGMGKIGKAVADRARGFKMRIIYHNRRSLDHFTGAEYVSFEDLFRESDILSLHCPLSEETQGLIGRDELKMMKSTAILVNTARGKVVDQEALIDALKTGTITAAGLDVTDPEPLPIMNELFKLDNCFVLPHIGTSTIEARKKMAKAACENLLAGLRGERLPTCVNPQVYSDYQPG